jgi:hypothetical protein
MVPLRLGQLADLISESEGFAKVLELVFLLKLSTRSP